MENMRQCLRELENRGYKSSFFIQDSKLFTGAGEPINPRFVEIDETHRIESDSDPDHQAVVYALSTRYPERKGLLVNGHGVYSESEKDEVIERISQKGANHENQ